MCFKLQVNFASHCMGWNALSEWAPKKGEIFLRQPELLASSSDPRPCGKTTAAVADLPSAPISPFMPATTRGPGRIRTPAVHAASNHHRVKTAPWKFRIFNQSFTPAWNCWPESETEK
jgi:hypothetical protein